MSRLSGIEEFACPPLRDKAEPLGPPPNDLPDCMMPDGAEPCGAYIKQYGELMAAERRLRRIAAIIELVDNRSMAADGPVIQTMKEMTQAEMTMIYNLAKGAA
jgi:hypothetical protein